MNSTFKPALVLMTGRAAAFGATFFVPLVLVRVLEPEEFGTYKQLFLLLTTLYLIAQAGMAESLYYFLPKEAAKAGNYIANSMIFLALAGVFSGGLLFALSPRIVEWFGNPSLAEHLVWVSAALPLMMIGAGLEIILVSCRKIGQAALTYGVSDFVRASLLILPALVWGDLGWIMAGAVLFGMARIAATFSHLRAAFSSELRPGFDAFRRQMAYALPFGLAAAIEVVQINYHQYAVSHYFDAATYAIYAVGCLQIPLVDFLANPTANVMMVRMAERLEPRSTDALVPIWSDATRKLILIFFPLAAFVIVEAESIIVLLFTEEYRASVPIFMAWSLMIPLAAFPTDGVLRVFARTRFLFAINLLRLGVVAVAISAFLSGFGLVGAALVTVSALAISKTVALFRIRSLLSAAWPDLLQIRVVAPAFGVTLGAFVPVFAVRAGGVLSLHLQLALEGFLFFFAYVVLATSSGIVHEGEREDVRRFLARWRVATETD